MQAGFSNGEQLWGTISSVGIVYRATAKVLNPGTLSARAMLPNCRWESKAQGATGAAGAPLSVVAVRERLESDVAALAVSLCLPICEANLPQRST